MTSSALKPWLAGCMLAACAIAALLLAAGGRAAGSARAAGRAAGSDQYCTGSYANLPARQGPPLRFGVDPGLGGSAGGAQLPSTPDDPAKDVAAVRALRPARGVLVVRLNRLFWSGGDALIAQFKHLAAQYEATGAKVELQVRYHPDSAHNGDLAGWQAYVRHVVDVFGPDPNVIGMTITNEVNVTFSPNTSDGSYTSARDALIGGIVAAHDEAMRRGYGRLSFGFTYAYRFSPPEDAAFFAYLGAHGGSAFRAALGFVGLDFYPGTIYPPAMQPGDTYRAEMAQALGTLRECYMQMAGIGARVPIWITENGVPTGGNTSEAEQASALGDLVSAASSYSGTYNVTDYRWFNLRDANSSQGGSLPAASATFATDGLLRDDYSPKPSFEAFRTAIAALGATEPSGRPPGGRCPQRRLRLRLRPTRSPVRAVSVYLGHRRLVHARGSGLRSIALSPPRRRAFTLRIVLRLGDGRIISYRRSFTRTACRIRARQPRAGGRGR